MIGKLTGRIDMLAPTFVLVDVGGVGYVVSASGRTLSALGSVGAPVSLWIETHVREDSITLYGFPDPSEQTWFRLLTSVQGVGARSALAILTVCTPDSLSLAIGAQDKNALIRADGVGPKLAVRILTELKDKVPTLFPPKSAGAEHGHAKETGAHTPPSSVPHPESQNLAQDALSALVNLGYARSDSFAAISATLAEDPEAFKTDNALQTMIRRALKRLGQ